MARYKNYDYHQTYLIPVSLEDQLLEGSLEHTIHVLVENTLDVSLFDGRYKNDKTGCPAYDPKILLKVVLFAYSRGLVGSRRIEKLCRTHVTCMALACMQQTDHSTIAAFVSSMQHEVVSLFCDILLVCEKHQLLGGTIFALDGVKLPSNASKQWSGTIDELTHKQEKLAANIEQLLEEHQ
jgi:transposase